MLNENANLRRTNKILVAKQQFLNTITSENIRLRKFLHAHKLNDYQLLLAEVLDLNLNPSNKKIVINKGSTDNVYVGQVVISDTGIVGQVIEVNLLSSIVMLITDANHALPVENIRTNQRYIAQGLGIKNLLVLLNILNDADLKIGDVFLSSNIGKRFPAGFPIAKITNIKTGLNNKFLTVELKPLVNFSILKEVLLIKK